MRAFVITLSAVSFMLVACPDAGVQDPIPRISGLSCEVDALEADSFIASFSFSYQDEDQDLDGDGANMRWWLNGQAQVPLALTGQHLGGNGKLTLNVSPLQADLEVEVRMSVVDAAGNESNVLTAQVDTHDPAGCSP